MFMCPIIGLQNAWTKPNKTTKRHWQKYNYGKQF
jgi:hypothetical protein